MEEDARIPPPQVACKNAEWRREFFRSSRRYLDPERNVREVRYGNRGVSFSREIRSFRMFTGVSR